MAVALAVVQRHGAALLVAAALQSDVEVAIGRDRDVARVAEIVGRHHGAEAIWQGNTAIARVARGWRGGVDG